MPRPVVIRSRWVFAACLVAAGGCASSRPLPRAVEGPAGGVQGGAWDVALPGPLLADAGGEASRRDAALGWTPAPGAVTRELESPRPTLTRVRRVYVPMSPFGTVYFLEPYPRREWR